MGSGIHRSQHASSLQRVDDLDNGRKACKSDKVKSPRLIQKFFKLSHSTQRSGSDPGNKYLHVRNFFS